MQTSKSQLSFVIYSWYQ